ncbi:MAG TPA: hypothetical protein VFE58_17485, partial [Tepidisphaeraceae bacterium]|nr:hypothetical protein [Tepidisphaeraceae bacterium]
MIRYAMAVVLVMAGAGWGQEWRPVERGDVRVSGDLGHRVMLNYSRLSEGYYEASKLEAVSPGWPGDAVGREILALTLLGEETGVESPSLGTLIGDVGKHLNQGGYLGKVLPEGVENEQYLSGHS